MEPGPRPLLLCAAPGIPLLGPSGSSAHLRGVARALHATCVVARREDARGNHAPDFDRPILESGVPGWPSWLRRYRDYREVWTARRIARLAYRQNPSLVWERHSLYSDAGWKLHAQGIPWILEVNAPLVEERSRYEELSLPTWARSWEKEVLQAAPRLVAVSAWLTRWLKEEMGCTGEILHLPNGVEPQVGDREATRRRLGLEGAFVLGFLGSMKPWHGVERLVELLEIFPDAQGLCVGEGPVRLPSHPRLRCVGQVSEREAADLVAAMDVGLAPYAADAPPWFCPLKILAYRAQGTPVVATDIGDCRLLTEEGGSVVQTTHDFPEAIRAWRGRRAPPSVRSWGQVVGEGLRPSGAAQKPPSW
ncbi:MAG TPA: glycosyltransferase family 4 protein [Myxococcota bacterium]|nr:glycosyltransferase family 4 protein [Myxococcota bacterium]